MNRPRPDDAGFTLVEVLLATSILVIVLGSIASALMVFLQNASYTSARDDHSGGAMTLSSYLDRDLASASAVPVVSAAAAPCTGSRNVTFSWTEFTATPDAPAPVAGTAYQSAYTVVADPAAAGRCRLQRTYRAGGTVVDQAVIVGNLLPGGVTTATSATCPAGTSAFVLRLRQYDADTTPGYSYSGCVGGRL